ncbi:rho GTPase-activating protein 7 [Hippoglossus hippoglossus]|uniref:rho GTPase-activating protein 7 n=1 Tax=Hippoglossus hippoglossus TaxID=8267 RepID=UPI00148D2D25|nr:rho GTPase-activating protein 7 [Hippoglossus hippoglossus]XP_034463380.1 rho GTPase-activating protein 7 [Hippoglossus hippoglossus]
MLIKKIEAREACDWLRAAGFPQYVQLFKDGRFPVDVEWARRDHRFLDEDALESLCRRLSTLNKCVEMRLEPRRSKRRGDDVEEEDFCAISPNWTYDRRTRRWRRLDSSVDSGRPTRPRDLSLRDASDRHDVCSIRSSSSTDSDAHDKGRRGPVTVTTTSAATDDQETSRSSSRCSSTNKTPSLDTSFSGPPSPVESGGSSSVSLETDAGLSDKPPRKTSSSLLRKMEKLRPRGGTTALLPSAGDGGGSDSGGRTRLVISGPILDEKRGAGLRGEGLHCTRLQNRPDSRASSSSPHTSSSSQSESSSTVSTPSPVTRVRSNCKRSNSGAGTTWNNQNLTGAESFRNQRNNGGGHDSLIFHIPDGHKPGTFPTSLAHKHASSCPAIDNTSVNWRTGSFHGYRPRSSNRHGTSSLATGTRDPSPGPSPLAMLDHRLSVYDNVPDDQPLAAGGGSNSDVERREESDVNRLLAGEDVFSALDSVLERINNLQQLVSSWSEDLSEDDFQRGSSSSSSSSTSSSSSSSSSSSHTQDSPVHSSSAASPYPSSLSHIHLEVKHPEEEEEEEEEEDEQRCEKVLVNGEEPLTRSSPPRSSRVSRRLHWSSEQSLMPSLTSSPGVENQSVSQFLQLQKHSLLKLTALMDKYSPSSKQGWNWTVPKPPRKTKALAVKGRRVFGAPLLLSVQQTGETLPPSILRALVHLRSSCLDQVGLFRKSGVKSRIQFLRELVESNPDGVSYDGQSAFDVADMVKQYFRDLPEPIFTSKLCESFLHIYQYFPKDQQLVAAQAAMLLLPDENREALMTLLFFLRDVVASVDENQMTPTNIAVCLAPSLFHLNTVKRDANAARSSPRKYSLGRPDQRDLSENLAATQALADMITEAQRLFQFPEFWPSRSQRAATEDVLSEEGGAASGQSGGEEERSNQLQHITQHLLKEARERSRGWESHAAPEQVELSFKKVDDGCPLWMWRGSVEVEAPQKELLHRLLREQELWEGHLRQSSVVQSMSKDTEVYHYLLQGQGLVSRPPQEHLLLRTWQADPSSGPLYLSSVSTEHPEVQLEGIRAHVHSCLYLLEPTGATKTRLTHLCRTDTRGRSNEWHSRVSGHLLASELLAIRDSFRGHFRETKI